MRIFLLLYMALTSINCISQENTDDDWQWRYCNEYEGKGAVRLKVKLTINDKINNDIYSLSYDGNFENSQKCSDYFQREYGKYPSDKKDRRVDITVTYRCAPCASYANKRLLDPAKKPESGSRKNNWGKAEQSKPCFNGDESAYKDFLYAISKLSSDIYLENIPCHNGKMYPEWSKRDEYGNKTNIPDDERKPIDDLYDELKQKSKERQLREYARQLEDAQTAKEAESLLNQLKELYDDLAGDNKAHDQNTDPSSRTSTKFNKYESEDGASVVENLSETGEVLSSVKVYDDHEVVSRADGSTVYRYDTDGDGTYDSETEFTQQGDVMSQNGHFNQFAPSDLNTSSSFPTEQNSHSTGTTLSEPEMTDKKPGFDFSTASEIAQVANSFSAADHGDIIEPLESASAISEYYNAGLAFLGFVKKPHDGTNATDAYNSAASIGLGQFSSASGSMYDRFTAPIPGMEYDVFDAGFDQMSNLLNGQEADPNAALRPVGQYLGKATLGERIWNYFLNDLKSSDQ